VTGGGPTVVVLPGPPRELQAMWPAALSTEALQAAISGRVHYRQDTIRMFGPAESALAEALRVAERDITGFGGLEITTCLRRAELEIVTRYEPGAADAYAALLAHLRERFGDAVYSTDGTTVDQQVAALLAGHWAATAESCTGGLVAGRLTDLAGSSAYLAGGVVSYSNAAKSELLGVDPALIETHGAVSEQVAEAMAAGALRRFGADIAVSTTGIAGPGGGSAEKPVGTVCFGVAMTGRPPVLRTVRLPGNRTDVRERSTTIALHLLRRTLLDANQPG
jgi:nicotinamide-nucleotide amidase